jgi:hypothetical protein
MKYVIIVLLLSSCAGTKIQQKRDRVLDCVKQLIEEDSGTAASYAVCKDIYQRKEE